MTTFEIDPSHTNAQFSVRHLMISNVKGSFQKITGTVVFDPDNLSASSVEANIDLSTVNTHEPQRDEHLRSADFFDVANHPLMTFRSKSFEKDGDQYKIHGDLRIRGVSKDVVLHVEETTPEVKDPWGNVKVGTSAWTKINRKDFGLAWNAPLEMGGFVVGDEVKITIEAELTKKG